MLAANTTLAQPFTDSNKQFSAIANTVKGKIYAQYHKALKLDPSLSGKVVLSISIGSNGKIKNCDVISTQLNNKVLEQKICGLLSTKSYQSLAKLPFLTQHEYTFFSAK